MPTSNLFQLNEITQLIKTTNPNALLDVGVGFGKYGFLAREYLELWGRQQDYGDWTRRIDGIEAFADYVGPLQRLIYNTIHIGNALEVLPTLDARYDLVLLIDVLEEFCPADGPGDTPCVAIGDRGKTRHLADAWGGRGQARLGPRAHGWPGRPIREHARRFWCPAAGLFLVPNLFCPNFAFRRGVDYNRTRRLGGGPRLDARWLAAGRLVPGSNAGEGTA
ncbi:MAG: hypothetical protein JW888_18630 [Pirellulales bacterium]|nr:hypothetical protein [Pirellulales bacterium]